MLAAANVLGLTKPEVVIPEVIIIKTKKVVVVARSLLK